MHQDRQGVAGFSWGGVSYFLGLLRILHLGLTVIDDLPETIVWMKGEKGFGLGDYFFSSFGFFLTISLTNSSALAILMHVSEDGISP